MFLGEGQNAPPLSGFGGCKRHIGEKSDWKRRYGVFPSGSEGGYHRGMQSEKAIANLGLPSLKIAGFQLWVHGREFPDSDDYWDGNWLNITAHCGAQGASVWVSGAIITTMDIAMFLRKCERLRDEVTGEAGIQPVEPNLEVLLQATDRLGHIRMRVQITPDHMSQRHEMTFEIDQSFLPEIITQCKAIIEDFRVKSEGGT